VDAAEAFEGSAEALDTTTVDAEAAVWDAALNGSAIQPEETPTSRSKQHSKPARPHVPVAELSVEEFVIRVSVGADPL
jgi:hypothetical protein